MTTKWRRPWALGGRWMAGSSLVFKSVVVGIALRARFELQAYQRESRTTALSREHSAGSCAVWGCVRQWEHRSALLAGCGACWWWGQFTEESLAAETEERMAKFADFVGVALSKLDAQRLSPHALAEEQQALRRVATVVAREEWDITLPTIVREVALLHHVTVPS